MLSEQELKRTSELRAQQEREFYGSTNPDSLTRSTWRQKKQAQQLDEVLFGSDGPPAPSKSCITHMVQLLQQHITELEIVLGLLGQKLEAALSPQVESLSQEQTAPEPPPEAASPLTEMLRDSNKELAQLVLMVQRITARVDI